MQFTRPVTEKKSPVIHRRPQNKEFKFKKTFIAKLRKMKFIDTKGEETYLTDYDIELISNSLNSLRVLDKVFLSGNSTKITLSQHSGIEAEKLRRADRHIQSVSKILREFRDDQLYVMSTYLLMIRSDDQPHDLEPDASNAVDRIDEIHRTLELIATRPEWFRNVIAGISMDPKHKKQDPGLFTTLDDLCNTLKERDIVVTRNRDSAPFGLLKDALSLVRPGIAAAQIESYLKETRQGLRKTDFGRRWGEIEEHLPKDAIDLSQPSDLDPGAGSDRHPRSTK